MAGFGKADSALASSEEVMLSGLLEMGIVWTAGAGPEPAADDAVTGLRAD